MNKNGTGGMNVHQVCLQCVLYVPIVVRGMQCSSVVPVSFRRVFLLAQEDKTNHDTAMTCFSCTCGCGICNNCITLVAYFSTLIVCPSSVKLALELYQHVTFMHK